MTEGQLGAGRSRIILLAVMCWSLLIPKSSKYCPYHYLTCPPNDPGKGKMILKTRSWQAFSTRGHIANMSHFEGHSFCHTAQLCHCCVKTDTVGKQTNVVVFQQSFFLKTDSVPDLAHGPYCALDCEVHEAGSVSVFVLRGTIQWWLRARPGITQSGFKSCSTTSQLSVHEQVA